MSPAGGGGGFLGGGGGGNGGGGGVNGLEMAETVDANRTPREELSVAASVGGGVDGVEGGMGGGMGSDLLPEPPVQLELPEDVIRRLREQSSNESISNEQ